MKFWRLLARAFVRRVAYTLAALLMGVVLSMCGIGRAEAMVTSGSCSAISGGCSRASAYAQCTSDVEAAYQQAMASNPNQYGNSSPQCVGPGAVGGRTDVMQYIARFVLSGGGYYGTSGYLSQSSYYYLVASECPSGQQWDEVTNTCKNVVVCTAGDVLVYGGLAYNSGTTDCQGGCSVRWSAPDDSGYSTGTKTGSQCDKDNFTCGANSLQIPKALPASNESPNACQPETCPEGQTKVNGVCRRQEQCPSGQHTNEKGECEKDSDTCPAGQTKGPDGSCVDNACPAGQVKANSGTCSADADGNGTADVDEGDDADDPDKATFSGGDSCDTPPACSGDVIMCGQARIQWRIECNTRKDSTVSGGSCDAMPLCVGKHCDAVEYAALIQQWKTACAVQKLAFGEDSGNADIIANDKAMKQAEVDALRGMSQDDGHGDVDVSKIWQSADEATGEGSGFNPNLFGGSGAGMCATGWELMGKKIEPPPAFWALAQMIGWLVVAAATLYMVGKIGD